MIRPIVKFGNPVLRAKGAVVGEITAEIRQLAEAIPDDTAWFTRGELKQIKTEYIDSADRYATWASEQKAAGDTPIGKK